MTFWGDRYRTHPLWPEVSRARRSLNEIDVGAEDHEEQQALAYAGAVLELLERRKDESDPLEVTPSMLQEAQSRVSDWIAALDHVLAGNYSMGNTVPHADGVLTTLATWPPMKPARYLSGISGAVDSFVERTTATLSGIAGRASGIDSRLTELSAAEDALNTKIDAEKQRISEAIASFTTESNDAVQAQLEEQQSNLDQQYSLWRQSDERYRAQATTLLEQLSKHEESARKTVHATVAWTVATDYGRYARGQSIAAWICDVGAALVGAGGLGAILFHLFALDPKADINIGLSFTRLAVSVAALGVAALLGRRGAQHHREARTAKRTDLALRKIGPFIADLPDDEQQLIVQEFTDRVFIRGDLESSNPTTGTPLRDQIAKLRGDRATTADDAS